MAVKLGARMLQGAKAVKTGTGIGLGATLSQGMSNIGSVGLRGGSYLQAAAKGAVTMGAIGGVSEWSQGGSFVGGAKSNLFSGAALGMVGRAANIGINKGGWENATVASTFKKAQSKITKGPIKKTNISKALQSKLAADQTSAVATQQVINNTKGKTPLLEHRAPLQLTGPIAFQTVGPNGGVLIR